MLLLVICFIGSRIVKITSRKNDKDVFFLGLYNKMPVIARKPLDLYHLYSTVQKYGGFEQVFAIFYTFKEGFYNWWNLSKPKSNSNYMQTCQVKDVCNVISNVQKDALLYIPLFSNLFCNCNLEELKVITSLIPKTCIW